MINRIARVLMLMALCLNVATAQLLVLEEDIEQAYRLESYSGDAMPNDLHQGKHAVFFFSPTDCDACDLIFNESALFEVPDLTITFVTNIVSTDLEMLLLKRPELNIWLDSRDLFAMMFSVTEVPTVFMVENGVVVNADYWPFHNEVTGLISTLHMFSLAESGPSIAEIVDSLVGRDLSDLYVAHNLSGENLLMICWDTCEVCNGAISRLSQDFIETERLPSLVPMVLNRQNPLGDATVQANTMLGDWTSAGFNPIFENTEISSSLVFDVSPITLYVDAGGVIKGGIVGFSESFNSLIDGLIGFEGEL